MRDRSEMRRWLAAGFSATVLVVALTLLVVPLIIPEPGPVAGPNLPSHTPRCLIREARSLTRSATSAFLTLEATRTVEAPVDAGLAGIFVAAVADPLSSLCPPPIQRNPIRPLELIVEEEEEEERDEVTRQIVSVPAPATEAVPDEARFEDRVNRDVEEEMVARDRGDPGLPLASPPPSREERQEPRRRRDTEESAERQNEERIAAVTELEEGDGDTSQAAARDPNVRTEPGPVEDSRLELAAFNPTFERAAEFITVPGASSPDYLDLPQGDRTLIDSFENLYWSYWDRIKNQVRPHWRPRSVYRERDPTGRVFGVEDRYTVLRVTLNGDGSLRHVYLERTSDLDFLDREAIRAVRAAQPFANVPEGLKDERGLLSFRFGFYFEVSSSSFRIRREDW